MLALAGSVLICEQAWGQSIQRLDPLSPGWDSYAAGISANGLVAVGTARNGMSSRAIRWNAAGDAEGLDPLAPGESSFAYGVNSDGSIAVGFGYNGTTDQAIRWNAGGDAESLDPLAPGQYSVAFGVSSDGSIAVGHGYNGTTNQAIRWNAAGDAEGLDPLAPGGSYARDVSADGSIAVGYGSNGTTAQAIRWNAAGDAEGLDPLAPGEYSFAFGVSADGSIAVGYGNNGTADRAIRWNAAGNAQGLDPLTPGGSSYAQDVSADGSVAVGSSDNGNSHEAVRWDAGGHVQSIRTLLMQNGVDMTGWTLVEATGVSADGRTVVGNGRVYEICPDVCPVLQTPWIARDIGLITVDAAAQSLASLGQAAQGAQNYIGGLIGQTQEYALQHAAGAHVPQYEPMGYAPDLGANFPNIKKRNDAYRWRAFGYAEGYARGNPEGGHGLGQGGLSYALADNTIIGGAFGFGGASYDMTMGGSADFIGVSGSLFAAYVPVEGFQAILSTTLAGYDTDLTRAYMNGAGTATSEGETDGAGFGAALRVGYAFNASETTVLTPFGAFEAIHVKLDGYTETGGPFPAVVGAIEDTATIGRLGIEAKHDLSDGTWLFASAVWAHRFEDESAAVDAQLIDLFAIAGATFLLDQDWTEVTGGVSIGLGDGLSRVSLSATAYVPGEGDVSVKGRLGVSRAF